MKPECERCGNPIGTLGEPKAGTVFGEGPSCLPCLLWSLGTHIQRRATAYELEAVGRLELLRDTTKEMADSLKANGFPSVADKLEHALLLANDFVPADNGPPQGDSRCDRCGAPAFLFLLGEDGGSFCLRDFPTEKLRQRIEPKAVPGGQSQRYVAGVDFGSGKDETKTAIVDTKIHDFAVNDQVEARMSASAPWRPGKVVGLRRNDIQVDFRDGPLLFLDPEHVRKPEANPWYDLGEKVEAQAEPDQPWSAGEIAGCEGVGESGPFLVLFEGQEPEQAVWIPKERIRKSEVQQGEGEPEIRKGDRVDARCEGGDYRPGEVVDLDPDDGAVRVLFDDEQWSVWLKPENVKRASPKKNYFFSGERVVAKRDNGKWGMATIRRGPSSDGSYALNFDGSCLEFSVHESRIRIPTPKPKKAAPDQFPIGAKVEARVDFKEPWCQGEVVELRASDGAVKVSFDGIPNVPIWLRRDHVRLPGGDQDYGALEMRQAWARWSPKNPWLPCRIANGMMGDEFYNVRFVGNKTFNRLPRNLVRFDPPGEEDPRGVGPPGGERLAVEGPRAPGPDVVTKFLQAAIDLSNHHGDPENLDLVGLARWMAEEYEK